MEIGGAGLALVVAWVPLKRRVIVLALTLELNTTCYEEKDPMDAEHL